VSATVTAPNLANTGTINLVGNPTAGTTNQATLDVTSGAAPSTWTGAANLSGDALLEFASGQITSIAGGATLTLNGAESRVADASDTTSNSALAHLASNAGTFQFRNGAGLADQATSTFATSGNFALIENATFSTLAGIGFTNSGAVYLDSDGGTGGSTLTIGGTLTNSGTIQIGNTGLSAPSTMTAGALVNASGGSFSMYGSASYAATATISGPASNAGTLTIGNYSAFDVTGGAAFTQTAGTTTVSANGAFSAATIDIDGGAFVVDATNFTNSGTLAAADGGDINLGAGGLTNLSGGTLTGRSYEVDAGSTLQLPNNAPIVTDDADIILSGAGSTIEDYNTSTGAYDTIDATLLTIGASGQLHLLAGRSWTTAGAAITNDGQIELGGGALTATASGASLTNAAGARIYGNGTITATIFTNSGTVEAKGGTLTLTNAVGGSGNLQIDTNADLILASSAATTDSATFNGAGATLTLDHTGDLSGAIGGIGLDDIFDLVGVTANGASVNGSDQLVVTENGTTVDTLQLSGNNSGFTFLTQAISGGTDVIGLPIPATVADYLDVVSLYDQIPEASKFPTQRRTPPPASTRSTTRTSTRSPSRTMAQSGSRWRSSRATRRRSPSSRTPTRSPTSSQSPTAFPISSATSAPWTPIPTSPR
jgi:hypothetical protein